jgi:hypothetical protein
MTFDEVMAALESEGTEQARKIYRRHHREDGGASGAEARC